MTLALLHSGHQVTWSAWRLEPSILAGALLACALYLYGLRFAHGVEWWRPLAFLTGSALIFVALASPLDAASDRLLSMHMLQHIVLTTFGPPLLLLGLPQPALRRLLPAGGRLSRLLSAVTIPFVAGAVFIMNMWFWHIPPVYEAALRGLPVHITMHIAFMATGLLFWWPIIAPLPEMSRAGGGARLLYLFITGFPMGVLALLFVSSQNVIYDFYHEQTEPLWGVSPLTDQQVAGVIMGSLGEAASFIAFSLIFVRFLLSDQPDSPSASPSALDHPL